MASDLDRLAKIKHIVVLMMENRSFDHMLGYLKRDGMPDVEGLTGEESNFDDDGNEYRVYEYPLDQTAFHRPGMPFDESLDPCHAPACVAQQMEDSNRGFVKNFVAQKNPPADQRGLPMGHYSARHLPTYDFLARQYCVCDAWHSSIPGDTWPNRLYSLAGRASDRVPLSKEILQGLERLFGHPPSAIPIFEVEAFTRQLADEQWRWYAHDPATLRCADARYREAFDLHRENFAFFDRLQVSLLTRALEGETVVGDSFLDDAATGKLRDISWIDPNFIDLHVLESNSNDDHPPSDVLAGQALVLDLYDALVKSPAWEDTLLIVVYDEHGGFFDHVVPPAVDDNQDFKTLGLRVPALVIGPRVRQFVCKQTFDHTTLIKTILLRFSQDPDEAIRRMGQRTANAAHLGVVLGDDPRTGIPDHEDLRQRIGAWRQQARANRAARDGAPSESPDGAGQPLMLSEFQQDFVRFATAMREHGLPPGRP
jgi:phospholipase C